jgi:hypothetical protein
MTTPFAGDAPRLQPTDRSSQRAARDVSINDFSWAARPRIFNTYVFSQTTQCLKGASNPHVC